MDVGPCATPRPGSISCAHDEREGDVARLLQLIMAGVLLLGAVGAWWWYSQTAEAEEAAVLAVQSALTDLRTQIKYRSAVGDAVVNGRGWPVTIEPAWWDNSPPINELARPDHPWLEVADKADYQLEHPRTRVMLGKEHAAFWYNPGNGIVRARVPQMVSDQSALEMYNRVNGAGVTELFDSTLRTGETVAAPVDFE